MCGRTTRTLSRVYKEISAIQRKIRKEVLQVYFRYLMPPEMCRMSVRYMTMCGCKICTEFKGLHNSLRQFRAQKAARGRGCEPSYLHDKPSDAVHEFLSGECEHVEDYNAACWNNCCDRCSDAKRYILSKFESESRAEISYKLYSNASCDRNHE